MRSTTSDLLQPKGQRMCFVFSQRVARPRYAKESGSFRFASQIGHAIVALGALLSLSRAVAAPELVLQEDAHLSAQFGSNTVTVTADKGLGRTFSWNECAFSPRMILRPTRWFGSLGIYNPGIEEAKSPARGKSCNGITRAVVQEGQLHFVDSAAAERWLTRYSRSRPTAWSSDGLVMQWAVVPRRQQFNVDLWQLCVGGHAVGLSGAKSQLGSPTRDAGSGPARRECATVEADVVTRTEETWAKLWREADEMNELRKNKGR